MGKDDYGVFSLEDRVAVVTGGNGGIGLGIVKGLAEAGATIVIASRNQEKTDKAVNELLSMGKKVTGLQVDVTDERSIASMVDSVISHYGRIDILVNNSGTGIRKLPQDSTLEEWRQVFTVNVEGTFLCCQKVYPHMVKQGGGKIINVGSMASVFGNDWLASYSASKGAVAQLTKSLAVAWAQSNIQVNAILPGWVYTTLTAPLKDQYRERYDHIISRTPIGRWGEPEEMAGCVVFLASNASNYITGTLIPIDGGFSAKG